MLTELLTQKHGALLLLLTDAIISTKTSTRQRTEIWSVIVIIVVVIIHHTSLVQRLLDVVVCAFWIEVGRPREVDKRKMSVAEFLMNLHTATGEVQVNMDLNTPLRHSGMAHILNGSHSFTCIPRVHPLMEWTIAAFAFPAEAGPHLPTTEGWKAELALVAGYIPR